MTFVRFLVAEMAKQEAEISGETNNQ